MRGASGRVASLVVLAALVLGGCSVPRGGGSATSDIAGCASVLPLARDAVHGAGTLVLIHRLGRDDAEAIYRELGAPPLPTAAPKLPPPGGPPPNPLPGPKPPKTCLVVYHGTYAPGAVTGAEPARAGRYALIVARVRHPLVYRVLLTDDLPAHLPGS